MVGINEELKAIEAASAVLSTNANSGEGIRVLRQAKYIAALAMTTFPSHKPLNDARHAVVITLSDLVHALETDPTPIEKIDTAKGAIRNLEWALKARQELPRSCVDRVFATAGRIDLLVNNAGVSLYGALEKVSTEQAWAVFETKFFGVLRMPR